MLTESDLHYYEELFQELGLEVEFSYVESFVMCLSLVVPIADSHKLHFNFDGVYWYLRCSTDFSIIASYVNWPKMGDEVGLSSTIKLYENHIINLRNVDFVNYLKKYVVNQLASVKP